MPPIYITGPSCAGKTTLAKELKARGYEAHDADVDVCDWYHHDSGIKVERPDEPENRPADWEEYHDWVMVEEVVKDLYNRSQDSTIFILGFCDNEPEMTAKYFEKVFCLEIDEVALNKRLRSRIRNRNGYGKDPDEAAHVRQRFKPKLARSRSAGITMIDATQPVEMVASHIIREIEA